MPIRFNFLFYSSLSAIFCGAVASAQMLSMPGLGSGGSSNGYGPLLMQGQDPLGNAPLMIPDGTTFSNQFAGMPTYYQQIPGFMGEATVQGANQNGAQDPVQLAEFMLQKSSQFEMQLNQPKPQTRADRRKDREERMKEEEEKDKKEEREDAREEKKREKEDKENDKSDWVKVKVDANTQGQTQTQPLAGQNVFVKKSDVANKAQCQTVGTTKKCTTTDNILAIQRRALVQNDEASQTAATIRCIECEELAKNEAARDQKVANAGALMANNVPNKGAISGAKACLDKMIADAKVHNLKYMTVVDYNQPDSNSRLYLLNLETNTAEALKVAQGAGSTKGSDDQYATFYSNAFCSEATSPGCYLTGEKYDSPKFGPSMKMDGEETRNSNARARCIAVHPYKSGKDKNSNRPEDTWGCFGMSEKDAAKVIAATNGGSVWYVQPRDNATIDTTTRSRCKDPKEENQCAVQRQSASSN